MVCDGHSVINFCLFVQGEPAMNNLKSVVFSISHILLDSN